MSGRDDDIGDAIVGMVLGAAVVGALIWLALLGLIFVPIGAGLWFLWKRWRYNPAAIARREMEALRSLHDSVRYLSGRIDLPDPEEMAATIIAVVNENLGEDRRVPSFLSAPIHHATEDVLALSGLEPLPAFDASLLAASADARNAMREQLYRLERLYRAGDEAVNALFSYLCNGVSAIVEAMPSGDSFDDDLFDYDFTVELLDVVDDPKRLAEALLYLPFNLDGPTVETFKEAALQNMAALSGKRIDDLLENPHKLPKPTETKGGGSEVLLQYLAGSPFLPLLEGRVAYRIPHEARFEHTHILAGTGHGKTQLIQRFVREDLKRIRAHHQLKARGILVSQGAPRSLIVIDGQGEMIEAIARRRFCAPDGPLADKVIVIDPTDTEHPLALNMFDVGQDELAKLDPVEREMVFNGTVELYVYLFGALLSAELAQKQDVLFRYVARLMLAIPNATLDTLRDVIENGEAYQPFIDTLDPQSQDFFRTQFFGGTEFKETKKQILRRLWGILSIQPLASMFNSPVNKIDLFAEMQAGKVILINTAKDFLKTDGARIFGRFWIAMIAQAALRRASLPKSARVDTHVYVDEAHEYVDDKVEEILNQARKYRIAMHLSHQNLGQLSPTQRATLASSTAIKMIGGVSDADARAYAGELRTDAERIKSARKRDGGTEFLTYVRNHTASAIKLNVPFGTLEQIDAMDAADYTALRQRIRTLYARTRDEKKPEQEAEGCASNIPEDEADAAHIVNDGNALEAEPSATSPPKRDIKKPPAKFELGPPEML